MAERLLIVDDEALVRGMVARIAEMLGLVPHEAAGGESALEIARREKIDIVLTDYEMPGMSGLELAEILLKEDGDRPVLMMTAYGDQEYADAASSVGIFDFFIKPFEMAHLAESIEKALQHRRLKTGSTDTP